MADQGGPELPGLAGRNRLGKRDPDVCPISGAGNLRNRRNAEFPAGLQEGSGILPPVGFLEVCRGKTTAVIAQERIDADGLLSGRTVVDHLIGHRQQPALVAVAAFHTGLVADAGLPLVTTGR